MVGRVEFAPWDEKGGRRRSNFPYKGIEDVVSSGWSSGRGRGENGIEVACKKQTSPKSEDVI